MNEKHIEDQSDEQTTHLKIKIANLKKHLKMLT